MRDFHFDERSDYLSIWALLLFDGRPPGPGSLLDIYAWVASRFERSSRSVFTSRPDSDCLREEGLGRRDCTGLADGWKQVH